MHYLVTTLCFKHKNILTVTHIFINITIDKNNIGIDTFFFTTTKESEKKYKNRKMDECPHNAHFRKINGIINRLKPGK